jgi:hypothetical protein
MKTKWIFISLVFVLILCSLNGQLTACCIGSPPGDPDCYECSEGVWVLSHCANCGHDSDCTGCYTCSACICTDDDSKCSGCLQCSGGTCIDDDSKCSGCRKCSGGTCVDDDSKCSACQKCSGGTCINCESDECCKNGLCKKCCKDSTKGTCEAHNSDCGCAHISWGDCTDNIKEWTLGAAHFCYTECPEACDYTLTMKDCYAWQACKNGALNIDSVCEGTSYCQWIYLGYCQECIPDGVAHVVQEWDCRCN